MYRLLACIAILLVSCLSSSGQLLPDPALVLRNSKERLLADLQRLPRYTCVQTITRKYFDQPFHWASPGSCKEVFEERNKRSHELTLRSWDRLRLDVAVADRQEIFSWVGAPRFEEGMLARVAGSGPLGTGDFGPFIGAIFRVGTLKFQGQQAVEGRRLLEYSYVVPEKVSRYEIDTSKNEQFITGYSGTFLLDRDDPDLFRLIVRTDELPHQSNKCQAISEVEYQRVAIHGSQVLIPRETLLRVIGRQGEETLSVTSYDKCREYSSTSVLRFETVDAPQNGGSTASSAEIRNPIPAGVRFDWRLVTPIDSDTAAAGDPLEAILRSSIHDKKGAVVAPAGTHIHGRLLLLAQGRDGYFNIALKFETIDLAGTTVPFNAKLVGSGMGPLRIEHIPLAGIPLGDVALFWFSAKHLKLNHLDSIGMTTLPTPKEEKTR